MLAPYIAIDNLAQTSEKSTFGIVRKILDFIMVGRLLHMTAIINFPFVYLLAIEALNSANTGNFIWYGYLTLYVGSLSVFAELDAWSRYQNFKMIKDMLFQYGFKIRLIKSFQYSKCQREAAVIAAKKTGYEKEVISFFRSCNRKWYHYFPTFLFSNPIYLFSKQFWLTTFFAKYYEPKYMLK